MVLRFSLHSLHCVCVLCDQELYQDQLFSQQAERVKAQRLEEFKEQMSWEVEHCSIALKKLQDRYSSHTHTIESPLIIEGKHSKNAIFSGSGTLSPLWSPWELSAPITESLPFVCQSLLILHYSSEEAAAQLKLMKMRMLMALQHNMKRPKWRWLKTALNWKVGKCLPDFLHL